MQSSHLRALPLVDLCCSLVQQVQGGLHCCPQQVIHLNYLRDGQSPLQSVPGIGQDALNGGPVRGKRGVGARGAAQYTKSPVRVAGDLRYRPCV